MVNLKEEFLQEVGEREVQYVCLHTLAIDGMPALDLHGDLIDVLPHLDWYYDADLVQQTVRGIIWYTDGSWSVRVMNKHYEEMWETCTKPSVGDCDF